MKLELEAYSNICETRVFRINGIDAAYKDFGEKCDTAQDRNKPRFCGNMRFVSFGPKQKVLEKYGISHQEYVSICKELRKAFSFGSCRLCG